MVVVRGLTTPRKAPSQSFVHLEQSSPAVPTPAESTINAQRASEYSPEDRVES
jgi:hypothetical protein